jgi:hypothetical protein
VAGACKLGDSPTNPGQSCLIIKQTVPSSLDGLYWIKPGATPAAYQAYCDMTTLGGGWTLWANLSYPAMSLVPPVTPSSNGYLDQSHYTELLNVSSTFMARGSTTRRPFFLAKSVAQTALCNNLLLPGPFDIPTSQAFLYGYSESQCGSLFPFQNAYLGLGANHQLVVYQSGSNEMWHADSPGGVSLGINFTSSENFLEMYMR